MVDGKRGKAATILYNAFDIVKEKLETINGSFRTSNENIMPVLEVKARRVGGSNSPKFLWKFVQTVVLH